MRAIQAACPAEHERQIPAHGIANRRGCKDGDACRVAAFAVGNLDDRQIRRAGSVTAARYARDVVLRVLVLAIMKMEHMVWPTGGIASHVSMGEGGHALQQCEGHQKKQSSSTSHYIIRPKFR